MKIDPATLFLTPETPEEYQEMRHMGRASMEDTRYPGAFPGWEKQWREVCKNHPRWDCYYHRFHEVVSYSALLYLEKQLGLQVMNLQNLLCRFIGDVLYSLPLTHS